MELNDTAIGYRGNKMKNKILALTFLTVVIGIGVSVNIPDTQASMFKGSKPVVSTQQTPVKETLSPGEVDDNLKASVAFHKKYNDNMPQIKDKPTARAIYTKLEKDCNGPGLKTSACTKSLLSTNQLFDALILKEKKAAGAATGTPPASALGKNQGNFSPRKPVSGKIR
jgi:hypothetical protein